MSEHVIMVNAALPGNGPLQTAVVDYLNGGEITGPFTVRPGDGIAWYLQLYIGAANSPLTVPYQLTFFGDAAKTTPSDAFFGVSSVQVPGGGMSPILHVRQLQGSVFFSVEAVGLGSIGLGTIIDPEIQTGGGPGHTVIIATVPTAYTVTWNVSTNTLSPPSGTLALKPKDTLEVDAIVNGQTAPPNFQIQFARVLGRGWSSPFVQGQGAFPSDTTFDNPVGPYPVKDDADPPASTTFTFTATTEDGKTISNPYSFDA